MSLKNYLKLDLKHKTKHKVITLGYALAVTFAFILSLTNNNYVEASVSKNERLDYLMIENSVASNLSNPETIYPESSVDNIKTLFSMISSFVKEKNVDQEITVKSGDTLISLLNDLGLNRQEANDIYYKLKKHYDPRDLRAGEKIKVQTVVDTQTQEIIALNSITIQPKAGERLVITQAEDGDFTVNKEKDELIEEVNSATGSIEGTLSHSMQKQGVPSRVVNNIIQIFAYSVDFRRDVRRGDKFEIIYENKISPDGKVVQSGDIIYAGLILRKEKIGLYRYKD